MSLLPKANHEQFAQLVARGESRAQSYVEAYGPSKGADQSACRLLKNAKISRRIAELRLEISSKMLSASIRERNFRLQQLQNRHDLLMQVVKERGGEYEGIQALGALVDPVSGVVPEASDFEVWRKTYPLLGMRLENKADQLAHVLEAGAPGGATGFMLRDYRGKSADRVIFKVDTPLLAELRQIEDQAGRELGELPEGDAGAGGPTTININFVSARRG